MVPEFANPYVFATEKFNHLKFSTTPHLITTMSLIYRRGNLSQQIRECADENTLSFFRPMHNDQSAPDFIFSSLIIIIPELMFFFHHYFLFSYYLNKTIFSPCCISLEESMRL